jgi:hypothetical protein
MKISENLKELLKNNGNIYKVLQKDNLYRLPNQYKLRMEIIDFLLKCDLKNFKLGENDIICLRKNLIGTRGLLKFVSIVRHDIKNMPSNDLVKIFKFDERIFDNSSNESEFIIHDNLIFFIYSLHIGDKKENDLLYYIKKDILKEAIQLYGKNKFKKLLMKIFEKLPVKNILEFYINEFNDYDKKLIEMLYNAFRKNNFVYDYFMFDYFDKANEYGLLNDNDINHIIKVFDNKWFIKDLKEKNKTLIDNLIISSKIICNDYKFEKCWDKLKKYFNDYIKPEYRCFDVMDLFEI